MESGMIIDFDWVCNECGSHEYSSSVSESDLYEWLACGNCGGTEFHKESAVNEGTCLKL